jgi:phage nucleotide-binding protein
MATTTNRAGRRASLPPQIRPLRREDAFIRMIVYGEPGVGKTPFACSAPNALVLDGDGGLESALVAGSTAKVWTVNDWNDMLEAYNWLAGGGHRQFDWLILDSITLFQERGLDNVMDDLVAKKSHRSIYLPDQGDYGQNMSRLGRTLRDLKKLPMNQVWTAHVFKEDYEKADGSIVERHMPLIQGKGMTNKICGYAGIVAHLETTERRDKATKEIKEYPVLTTSKKDGWYGKDRYSAIGRMVNPTVPKVIAAIEAKLDPTKANKETE